MLRDIACHSDGMLFRQSIVPSFKVAQLWILCHTSKDFYGMFRPCVLSCLDLRDDQLQKAFVARLLNAISSKSWPLEMRSATMCSATMAQLKSKGYDLEERDDSGMTALMWASYKGEANTARVLVEYGASLEAVDREGMTALLWASYEGHADTARVLVELGASLEAVDGEDGMTALLWASYEGHADTVGVLVEHGASLEAVDQEGNTALQLALNNDKRKVAKLLCKHGARGALCYAAKNDLRGMVAELISKGHDLKECDKRGKTALQLASYYGNRKVAKLLCKHGARGALCHAAKNDLRDMVTELISKGHDLEECDKNGKTALELAAEAHDGEGHSEVVGLLIKAGIEAGQWQDVNAGLGSAGKTLLMYASQCGQEESVGRLIEKGASLEAVDKNGETALMLASYKGEANTARVLVEYGASLVTVDREGMTALMWASREGHADTARVLVELGASLEAVDGEDGMTALLWASYEGHADTVGVLVEHGASLEAVDQEGNTALQLALNNDKRKVAKLLCKHGARGALCHAAKNDLRGMVQELISKGHDLEECDKNGKTALELAAEAHDDEGHSEVVGLLIKAGIESGQWHDVNACLGSAGKTLLMYASQGGQEESVRALIEKGAILEAVDEEGNTALQLASYYGNRKVAEMLCKHGARGALCYAAKNDLRGMVAELISKGHDLEECDKRGNTALQLALDCGNRKVAKLLCKRGARGALCHAAKNDLRDMVAELISKGHDLEECDKNGKTALELAAEAHDGEGHSEVVGLLIKAGIESGQWHDVNAGLGSAGKTLLMYASQCGQEESVRALIEKGASLEAVDEEGNTALQLASYYGNRKVAEMLCKHGARGALCHAAKNDLRGMVAELISKGHDLEECDKRGNTALQLASDCGNRKVAKLLCKRGARGALCHAAKNDLRDMVAELISKGHDLEECDKNGKTALELAAEAHDGEGHSEVVGLLIKAGIESGQWQDVNAGLGSAGKTLLMYASQCGREESVRALIEKGASLEEVDKNGETALMLASRNGHADTVRVLVEHDVSIDAVYRIGKKTALQIAEVEGESAVVAVLKEQYVARGLTVPVYEEEEEEEKERIQFEYSEDSEGSMQDFLDDSEDSMQDFLEDSGESEDSMEEFL